MQPVSSALDLLLEAQHFDRLPRTGFLQRGVADPESIAEHSWQVTFLVWVLGTGVADLDLGRALEIALIHDLAELRTGDLPRLATCYFPDGVKHSAERRALDDLLAHLPEERRRRAAEYQAGVSLEARFVKSCDRLQLLLKVYVYERSGHAALEELWQETGAFDDGGFEVVRRLHTELSARRER